MSFLINPRFVVIVLSSTCLLMSTNGFTQTQDLSRSVDASIDAASESETLSGSGVIVRQLGDSTLEEYRVSGRTRSVKITPGSGAGVPYFLIDADGDGEVGTSSDSGNDGVTGWQIMNW